MKAFSTAKGISKVFGVVCLLTLGWLSGMAAAGSPVPVMVNAFDTHPFASTSPQGIAFIPSIGAYAIVDDVADTVSIVSPKGILLDQFSIAGYSNYASGITFIPATGRLAVVDDGADEVFFFDLSGIYAGQFDTAQFAGGGGAGATNPQGITYIPSTDSLAIIDPTQDEVFFVDLSGNYLGQFDTSAFSGNPTGIACTEDGNLAIADSSSDDVYIVDLAGTLVEQFDIGFVSWSAYGLTVNSADGTFVVVDLSADRVFGIDAQGEYLSSFDTYGFGAAAPVGITHIAGTDNFAIVDRTGAEVYVVNTAGIVQGQCDISSFSTAARDIAYLPSSGTFAIIDDGADEIYFMDGDCNLLGQTDTATAGINANAPTGITYLPAMDKLAIVDLNRDAALFIDPRLPGRIVRQFSTAVSGSTSPHGITTIGDTGNLAVIDNSADEVFVFNINGVMLYRFDTAPFSLNPQGIAYDPVNQVFAILESTGQEVMLLSLPALTFASSGCSGDGNCDGDVDGADLARLAADFGRNDCP
jgi:uncharacterized protein YjiK